MSDEKANDLLRETLAEMQRELADLRRPKRILLVDDDELLVQIMKRWMRDYNATLDCVATFEEGLKAAASNDYDLIMLDVKLAGPRDGIELFGEIRNLLGESPPVAFFTGFFAPDIATRSEKFGFAPFLKKPEQINPKFIRSFLKCFGVADRA